MDYILIPFKLQDIIHAYIQEDSMEKNLVKAKLRSGKPVIGTFVRMNSISMEILGRTGWDFAIIDAERGVHTMEDHSNMIRAAKSVGLSPIVRVPGTDPVNAMRALDAGAEGVQFPQLTNLDQIREVCKATRYYPPLANAACAAMWPPVFSSRGRS